MATSFSTAPQTSAVPTAAPSAAWLFNPIVVRESRARWRGSRAYLLAFFYALVLSAGMWWKYAEINARGGGSLSGEQFGLAAQHGNELFWTLSLLQAGIWLLIAPALTSTAITVERESGLLVAMLLSKMTPLQIVIGKWISALSFVLLLIVAALPVTAICFLMGGVSQEEFVGSLLIQIATAFFGAALGLATSASQKRAASSLGATFGYVALWLITSGVAFFWAANYPAIGGLFSFYGWTNPLWSMYFLIAPESWMPGYPGQFLLPTGWQAWHYTVLSLLALCAWQLWRSAEILRTTPELQDEYDQAPPVIAAPVFANPYAPPPRAPYLGNERWRVPFASQILFGDAAMRRELGACWKTRTPTRRALAFLSVPVFFTACGMLWSLFLLWQSPEMFKAADIFLSLTMVFSIVWIMGCALMGAGTIARERETGTWNGLRLTLLSERSILTAKVLAPVVACVIYSLPILPLMMVFCWPDHVGITQTALADAGLVQWLMSWALMIAVALECSCLGAWWSQRAQSSAQASGAMLGTLGVAWIAIPALAGSLFSMKSAIFWHPIAGLMEILTRSGQNGFFGSGGDLMPLWPLFFGMLMWHLGVAALFFALTLRRFRAANRLERA